jgi:hypothetical protein
VNPVFFESAGDFRDWLEQNHDSADELLLGLHKKGSGKPSITLREAQDEALCFGWIDGKARSIDESSWAIRLTPRRPGSVWSAVNIKAAHKLIANGRMTRAGLTAFEKRDEKRAKQYSYEREHPEFDAASEAAFPREPDRVGLLPSPARGLPAPAHVVGDEREDGRDAGEAAGGGHRHFDAGATDRSDEEPLQASQHTKMSQTSLLTPSS